VAMLPMGARGVQQPPRTMLYVFSLTGGRVSRIRPTIFLSPPLVGAHLPGWRCRPRTGEVGGPCRNSDRRSALVDMHALKAARAQRVLTRRCARRLSLPTRLFKRAPMTLVQSIAPPARGDWARTRSLLQETVPVSGRTAPAPPPPPHVRQMGNLPPVPHMSGQTI